MLTLRNNWETTPLCAKTMAKSWSIKCDSFEHKRVSHGKKLFDELSRDSTLDSAEKRFKVEVFNRVIDITTIH